MVVPPENNGSDNAWLRGEHGGSLPMDGWGDIDGTGGLGDQCRCGKGSVPERSAATGDRVSSATKRGMKRKAGGQAMRKTESQTIERIAAGRK